MSIISLAYEYTELEKTHFWLRELSKHHCRFLLLWSLVLEDCHYIMQYVFYL